MDEHLKAQPTGWEGASRDPEGANLMGHQETLKGQVQKLEACNHSIKRRNSIHQLSGCATLDKTGLGPS